MNRTPSTAKTVGKWVGILFIGGGIGALFAPGHPIAPPLGYGMIALGLPLYLWLRRYPEVGGAALVWRVIKLVALVFALAAIVAVLTNLRGSVK